MKSYELSLIRSEGLSKDDLNFSVYVNESCYGVLELSSAHPQKTLYLPTSGRLGLRVSDLLSFIGETYVDFSILEKDGLQWLPILELNSQPIEVLPDEVGSPRILISLQVRSKSPGLPIHIPKIEESIEENRETPSHREASIEEIEVLEDLQDNRESVKETSQDNYEDIIEQLQLDLDKSLKKNFAKKKKLRETHFQLAILNKKLKGFSSPQQSNQTENLKKQVAELENKLSVSEKHRERLEVSVIGLKKDYEKSENSLRDMVKALEARLKETCRALDNSERTLKEKTSKIRGLESQVKETEIEIEKVLTQLAKEKNKPLASCAECEKLQLEIKGHTENTKRLYQSIEIMNEKMNTQEFHNQELMIANQFLCQENELIKKNAESGQYFELFNNDLIKDELDELFLALYPKVFAKSVKVVPGLYVIDGKKIKVIRVEDKVLFFLDNNEVLFSDSSELGPRHEKNSYSLEDISNQMENYNMQNLIHSRGNNRDSKLRVLTKQW